METNYSRQKSNCFAYFKVNKTDQQAISTGRFTIFDFISNSFHFSFSKKQLAIKVLESLKEKPKAFKELVEELKASKSSLYLVVTALKNSGLIESKGKNKPFRLSQGFSQSLTSYASWWINWISIINSSK